MLDLNELEQLVMFADMGTLSLAAQQLHISQPTITRTMQQLEETFGVSLFVRGKNKIRLNDTGKKAVEEARELLLKADNVLNHVRDFDKNLHTITVTSCAPAPLWDLLPTLSSAYPQMTIASSLKEIPSILEDLSSDSCHLAILPEQIQTDGYINMPFLEENLSVCVLPSHELATKKSVTFSELNGFNFLLRSDIGFWDEMCRKEMPSSKFLVQTDEFEFQELIKESSLPCFTTNLAINYHKLLGGRRIIPITNPQANVTYSLVCRSKYKTYAAAVLPFP